MAANYSCLLLDLDGTLLNFRAAEKAALLATLQKCELPTSPEYAEVFSGINAKSWQAMEKGEIKKDIMLVRRFTLLLEAMSSKCDPARMNREFTAYLAQETEPYPGAAELLAELSEFCTLAVITNGLAKVQKQHLQASGLLPYFDAVIISEQVRAEKPSSRIFDHAIKELGIKNRNRVLVVGDSLTADIKGAANAKLHSCWCNFEKEDNNTNIRPTHTVYNYEQLKLVALGKEMMEYANLREKRHMV